MRFGWMAAALTVAAQACTLEEVAVSEELKDELGFGAERPDSFEDQLIGHAAAFQMVRIMHQVQVVDHMHYNFIRMYRYIWNTLHYFQ